MAVSASAQIHPTAIIDPQAELQDGVEVGPFVIIEGRVVVGANTKISPGAYLIGTLTIGENNDIGKGVVIGEKPQHLAYKGEVTTTVIGDGNVFREYVTIHRGHAPTGVTRIGHNNFLMANAHVGHDAQIGNNVILANAALVAGYAEVHDRALLSGSTAVHQFTRIGKGALLGGVSCATKDVLPYMMLVGRNKIVGVNVIGMRRAGLGSERIRAVREAYRILYRTGSVQKVGVATLERELGHLDIITEMLEFIRSSKRGFVSSNQVDRDQTAEAA